jgi:hypothetical protein
VCKLIEITAVVIELLKGSTAEYEEEVAKYFRALIVIELCYKMVQ